MGGASANLLELRKEKISVQMAKNFSPLEEKKQDMVETRAGKPLGSSYARGYKERKISYVSALSNESG